MTVPDFEIDARIRAKSLELVVSPDARTASEGSVVSHEVRRVGVPERMESREPYRDVAIEKRIVAEISRNTRER